MTTIKKDALLAPRNPQYSRVLGLDWETYFDQDYTLKKLSTSEYIRDPRFKAHGVGARFNDEKKATWVTAKEVPDFLATVDWSETALLCHHGQFDGLILSHHYGHIPAYYLCTMAMCAAWFPKSMGKSLEALSNRLGNGHKVSNVLMRTKGIRDLPPELEHELGWVYGVQDVDLMWEDFLAMLPAFPQDELDLIDHTLRCFIEPVLEVDLPLASQALETEIAYRRDMMEQAAALLHCTPEEAKKKLSSNEQFAALLTSLGATVGMKPGKSKGEVVMKPALAKNDLEFQALLEDPNPVVRDLCESRLAAKSTIGETRAQRLMDHALPALPIYYNFCGAHTFRWSGGDKLNPQNFPSKRSKQGNILRRAIVAPRGYQLVVIDSAQIEDRMNCWLAGQTDILEIYRNGGDPYGATADKLYGLPPGTINKENPGENGERMGGKTARLGLGFGCGVNTYRLIVQVGAFGPARPGFSEQDAFSHVHAYRNSSRAITGFWDQLDLNLRRMIRGEEFDYYSPYHDEKIFTFHPEGIDMPNGLILWYPELAHGPKGVSYKSSKNGRSFLWGGKVDENVTQSAARSVVAHQALLIGEYFRIAMMTHDEVIYLAPTEKAQAAYEFGLEVMSSALPDWCPTLPVAAEGGYAKEYSK